jgi:hypothetical protein
MLIDTTIFLTNGKRFNGIALLECENEEAYVAELRRRFSHLAPDERNVYCDELVLNGLGSHNAVRAMLTGEEYYPKSLLQACEDVSQMMKPLIELLRNYDGPRFVIPKDGSEPYSLMSKLELMENEIELAISLATKLYRSEE